MDGAGISITPRSRVEALRYSADVPEGGPSMLVPSVTRCIPAPVVPRGMLTLVIASSAAMCAPGSTPTTSATAGHGAVPEIRDTVGAGHAAPGPSILVRLAHHATLACPDCLLVHADAAAPPVLHAQLAALGAALASLRADVAWSESGPDGRAFIVGTYDDEPHDAVPRLHVFPEWRRPQERVDLEGVRRAWFLGPRLLGLDPDPLRPPAALQAGATDRGAPEPWTDTTAFVLDVASPTIVRRIDGVRPNLVRGDASGTLLAVSADGMQVLHGAGTAAPAPMVTLHTGEITELAILQGGAVILLSVEDPGLGGRILTLVPDHAEGAWHIASSLPGRLPAGGGRIDDGRAFIREDARRAGPYRMLAVDRAGHASAAGPPGFDSRLERPVSVSPCSRFAVTVRYRAEGGRTHTVRAIDRGVHGPLPPMPPGADDLRPLWLETGGGASGGMITGTAQRAAP